MLMNVFRSLLVTMFLASTAPGYAYSCASPCGMSQKQMLACARLCASLKVDGGKATLGKAECVSLKAKASQDMIVVAVAKAPAFLGMAVILPQEVSIHSAPVIVAGMLRGPPLASPVEKALFENPSQNSPPAFI